jgi:hypothetical protein
MRALERNGKHAFTHLRQATLRIAVAQSAPHISEPQVPANAQVQVKLTCARMSSSQTSFSIHNAVCC